MITHYAKALAAVLLASCGVTATATQKHQAANPFHNIVVFDKTFATHELSHRAPDYIYSDYRRVSPDGKYVARVTITDAEVGSVTVYRNFSGSHPFEKARKVSREFVNIDNCAWIPGRPHSLVVATGGADYGPGFIAFWTGRGHTRFLRRAKSPDGEGYSIRSVAADGSSLIYEHFGDNSPDPDDNHTSRLLLRLPRS